MLNNNLLQRQQKGIHSQTLGHYSIQVIAKAEIFRPHAESMDRLCHLLKKKLLVKRLPPFDIPGSSLGAIDGEFATGIVPLIRDDRRRVILKLIN